jgi:hypothetical protein
MRRRAATARESRDSREPQRIQKLPRRMQRSRAAAFDMSEEDQSDGGIVIKDKFFDFETCDEIGLSKSEVRLLSLHDAA